MRQRSMCRSGEAVLVDPTTRHKHAADHIGVGSRRGTDELVVPQRAQPPKVGIERRNSGRVGKKIDAVPVRVEPYFLRLRAEQRHRFGPVAALGADQWQSQFIGVAAAFDCQQSRPSRAEGHPLTTIAGEQDMSTRERGVAAQAHFLGRSEPAKLPIRFRGSIAHDESGLGEEILLRDREHHRVV